MPDPALPAAHRRPSGGPALVQAQAPYARVKEFLKQGLASGRWPPGALMPSEAELVAQFGVSRMTVTRALRELQNEGLVTRVQGLGTYAAHLLQVASTLTIRDLHEEITARGHLHHAEVHVAREESASATVATQLGLARGAPVFHTLIVHFENGLALQCEDRFVNPACAPDYLHTDFTQITPTHYLLQVAPLWEAQYSVEAGLPSAREARLLGIPVHEPCLIIVRRTVNHGVPITVARLVHPGSRYRVEGQFKP
ncbi:MAG: histidine utilization repressor [Rhodoferax sp.]|jgi:GntR family histidine utilization transcriptional repressor|nr:histidine utilization repressor [Rhodoferax sp.]